MKMIPTYVLEPEEFNAARRIKHLVGYVLPEGPEREAEVAAAAPLFRKNDAMSEERYMDAYAALQHLHKRLEEDSDPARWEGAGAFMAEERKYHAAMVWEAVLRLPHPTALAHVEIVAKYIDPKYVGI